MKSKFSFLRTFKFAGAIVAFLIGSGFATGQEVMQFFTAYGTWGIAGALITMALFSFLCAILMNYGYTHKNSANTAESNVFYHYFGKVFGTFLEWFTPIFCFLIVVIMISGAGATLNQYFGLPHLVGRIIMTVLTAAASYFGLKRLVDIIGYLGPFTILITLIIGLITLLQNPGALARVDAVIGMTKDVPFGFGGSTAFWLGGAVIYVAYNMTCSVPFLNELGQEASSRREAIWGGVLGGVFLMSAGLILAMAMMTLFTDVIAVEIPVLYLAERISPVLGSLFTAVLLGEIFSTSAPMLWTVANRFGGKDGSTKNRLVVLVGSALAFVGSSLPFGKLVGTIYPSTGYIGTALIVCVILRHFIDVAARKKKAR